MKEQAVAQSQWVDLIFAEGEIEAARQCLMYEQLPTFKRIKDEYHVALTYGKIANIYEFYEQWDDALFIRETEELLRYKVLGDFKHNKYH